MRQLAQIIIWVVTVTSGVLSIAWYLGRYGYDPFDQVLVTAPYLLSAAPVVFSLFMVAFVGPRLFRFVQEIWLAGKPVAAKRESFRIVGSDPVHTGVVMGEIDLNKMPDQAWIDCYRNPREWVLAFGVPQVVGKKIVLRCPEDMLETGVEWAMKGVDMANECYERHLEEWRRKLMEANLRKREEDRHRRELERKAKQGS